MPTFFSESVHDILDGVMCGYLLIFKRAQVNYVLNASNLYLHSHMKRLDVEG
jgi:hypothetical protein